MTIVGIPPTHIDREWTNDKVMKKANEEAGTAMNDPNATPNIKKVFTIIHNKNSIASTYNQIRRKSPVKTIHIRKR